MEFIEKNNIFHLKEGRLEFYTPQSYLGRYNAILGERMEIIGLVPYKWYKSKNDTKPTKVGIFNNPSVIVTYPLDIIQNVKDSIWDGIYSTTNTNEYTKLIFEGGDRMMNKYIVQNLNNVTNFTTLLIEGKIDNNIPYPYLCKAWLKNQMMNDKDLHVPATTLNAVIYELCRWQKNKDVRFGSVLGKDPTHSPVDYRFIGIRQICASNSVFAALAFEDMNSMLDSSLNMTTKEKEQKISPLEEIIKY